MYDDITYFNFTLHSAIYEGVGRLESHNALLCIISVSKLYSYSYNINFIIKLPD